MMPGYGEQMRAIRCAALAVPAWWRPDVLGSCARVNRTCMQAARAVCMHALCPLPPHTPAHPPPPKRSLRYVPTAVLSRQTAGLRGRSLILNLPGKPKSIRETIDEVRGSGS